MFEKDEYVNHQSSGVCQIIRKETITFNNVSQEYFVCQPLFGHNKNMTIKVPVNNPTSLSKIISKKDALKFIDSLSKLDSSWEENAKSRSALYNPVLKEANLSKIASLLKSIYIKKHENAKLSTADKDFIVSAEILLFGELSVALSIKYEEVISFIENRIGKNNFFTNN